MKYKLTEENKENNGVTLYRIEALKAFGNVVTGDLGGWVESENNLSQDGDAWVYDAAWVYGDARIYGNAEIYDDVVIYGNANVFGNARIYGNARICGDARIYDDVVIYGDVAIYGDAGIGSTPSSGVVHESTPPQITAPKLFAKH